MWANAIITHEELVPLYIWYFMFGGMMSLFLFNFHIFYNIHTYIHTIHSSFAIRWGLSPFLHRWFAQLGNLLVVPGRESNSGLPYSKPTRYQLSQAAPYDIALRLWEYICIKSNTSVIPKLRTLTAVTFFFSGVFSVFLYIWTEGVFFDVRF